MTRDARPDFIGWPAKPAAVDTRRQCDGCLDLTDTTRSQGLSLCAACLRLELPEPKASDITRLFGGVAA